MFKNILKFLFSWVPFTPSSWRDPDFKRIKGKTYVREMPKVGRNEPCPCGSNVKYKKCHGK